MEYEKDFYQNIDCKNILLVNAINKMNMIYYPGKLKICFQIKISNIYFSYKTL